MMGDNKFFEKNVLEYFHSDLIHHIEFDYYGTRLATASSDKTIIIWNRTKTGEWVKNSTIKCHAGAVWRVRWANPEFGQIIATCSFDGAISILEQVSNEEYDYGPRKKVNQETPANQWKCHRTLYEDKNNISDIKFAPAHFGLVLISCNAKGRVRIYEACDIIRLDDWTKLREFEVFDGYRCAALAISDSRLYSPLLCVVSDEETLVAKQQNSAERLNRFAMYQYLEKQRTWIGVTSMDYDVKNIYDNPCNIDKPIFDCAFAPSAGRAFHQLAVTVDHEIWIYHFTENLKKKNEMECSVDQTDSKAVEAETDTFYYNSHRAYILTTNLQTMVKRISFNMTGNLLTAVCYNQKIFTYQSSFIPLDEDIVDDTNSMYVEWKLVEER